jgi:hypothetical protein
LFTELIAAHGRIVLFEGSGKLMAAIATGDKIQGICSIRVDAG